MPLLALLRSLVTGLRHSVPQTGEQQGKDISAQVHRNKPVPEEEEDEEEEEEEQVLIEKDNEKVEVRVLVCVIAGTDLL